MNCDEFRSAVLQGHEGEMTAQHESGCASCRSQASGLRSASAALASPMVWEEPSPELGGQIESLIGDATGRGFEYPGSTSHPNRKWLAAAGIAASLILFVGIFVTNRTPAPDWEVALPATDLASDAAGIVRGWNEEAGTRMVVDIAGLAPAPDGFVYEFWLSSGPLHISAGTFHSSGEIELWSGVTRAAFPRLWITLEVIDEDESPSEHTVLDTGSEDV